MSITEQLRVALEGEDAPDHVDVLMGPVEEPKLVDDIEDIERSMDVHDNLSKLVSTVESIPVIDQSHKELVDVVMSLAFSGTGYSYRPLALSMESAGESKTSALLATIEAIWQRIVDTLKRIGQAFMAFWDTVFSSSTRVKKAIYRLRRRAETMSGRPLKLPSTSLRHETLYTLINNRPITDGHEIVKGLVELKRQMSVILGEHVHRIIAVGTEFNKALGSDKASSSDYLRTVIRASDKFDIDRTASALGVYSYNDQRFRKNEVECAPPLLGNKSLFVKRNPIYRSDDPGLVGQAEAIRQLGISMLHSDNRISATTGSEIATIPATTVVQIALRMEEMMDMVDKFVHGQDKKKISELYNNLTEKVTTAKKWMEHNELTKADLDNYHSAMRFATTFAKWSERPHDQMVVHSISVCRAIISACHKCLSNHG